MPGLVRAVGRTAVVAGTAGAVHHHQQKRWAEKDQAADAQAYQQQQQYAPPPPQYAAPPPQYAPEPQYDEPAVDPAVDKINQLAELHAKGILSDEEFAAAKAKELGI